MEYERGYIDGLSLALTAIHTVYYVPNSYEEVEEILEKAISNMEELRDLKLRVAEALQDGNK